MAYALTQSAGFGHAPSDGINSEQFNHEIVRGLLAAVASIWQLEDQVAETCVQKAIEIFHVEGAKCQSDARNMAGGLARNVAGGLAPWQIRRVKRHVSDKLDRSISTRELARVCGLSVSHFNRAFQASFSICPHAYILKERVSLAQRMMLATREPLSRVAVACGFSDQSHLTRVFGRAVGETPYGWRRNRLLSN
ncbi:helix-turn-helix domain-containing protein [Candidatus Phyllobacterium onerii]|uniref:helix-turn-helix domain-containing protein n=1 Tax=Candidatus Phyllobacterium onerii TaxID=3020828 RepID=UPI00233146FF|nr:AraC family transcriptional regulator [Phyllobacterium sp. IY22]